MQEIGNLIDDIPYISEKRKNFYKDLLTMRYEKILVPTLQKLFERNAEQIADKTKNLTPSDFQTIYANVIQRIRNAPRYQLCRLRFLEPEQELYFRRADEKKAILYNADCTLTKFDVTGVAPIRKDYQEIKAFLFEMEQAIQTPDSRTERDAYPISQELPASVFPSQYTDSHSAEPDIER